MPSRHSLPRALVLLTLGGGLGTGLAATAGAGIGPREEIAAVAVALGVLAGAALYLGYDTRRQVGRTLSKVEQTRARVLTLPDRKLVGAWITDTRNHLHGDVSTLHGKVRDDMLQVEALLNLHAMIPVQAPLPASRGWAASPDLLLAYVGEIFVRRPKLILECGSGLSTLWAALALQAAGIDGRVVALEHDADFCAVTRQNLATHGVGHLAEVRYAPIEAVEVGAGSQPWYPLGAVDDLDKVDLLFVDGPIGSLDPEARYPAVPLLRERLTPGAAIILDDADRPEERNVVEHWRRDWPELSYELLAAEKGAVRLRVPESAGPVIDLEVGVRCRPR